MSGKTGYTAGPWSVAATDDCLILKGRQKVASTYPEKISADEECANARLIAAAPDLLVALKELHVAAWGVIPDGQDAENLERLRAARDVARAAIAKAEQSS